MLRTLKKLMAVGSITVLATVGLGAAGGAAYADTASTSLAPVVIQPTPLCYGIFDTLGNGGKACLEDLTRQTTGYTNQETQVVYTATISLQICYLNNCNLSRRVVTGKTGAGADQDQLVPRVTYGSINVPIIVSTCVKTTCTPTSVNVPTVKVEILPVGTGPALTLCALGSCPDLSSTFEATRFTFDSGDYAMVAN